MGGSGNTAVFSGKDEAAGVVPSGAIQDEACMSAGRDMQADPGERGTPPALEPYAAGMRLPVIRRPMTRHCSGLDTCPVLTFGKRR